MKLRYGWFLYLSVGICVGATAAPSANVVERGEHHKVIQTRTVVTATDGTEEVRTNSYTELRTGMHIRKPDTGEWTDANQAITPLLDGAMVDGTALPILFANNLNSPHPITMWAGPRRIRVRLLGLAYVDNASAVWVATVKDSIGTIVGNDEVLYEDAMNDLPGVAVRYRVGGASLEQDVILTQDALPDPAALNLDLQSVRLCAISEFFADNEVLVVNAGSDGGFIDQSISFGRAHVGKGKAFLIGNEEAGVPVIKSLQQSQGRKYLIESIKLQSVEQQLQTLPQAAALPGKDERIKQLALSVKPKQQLFATVAPQPKLKPEPKMRMAAVSPVRTGLAIDWLVTLASANPLTLKGDSTYYVSGPVYVTNLTIDPNTIVKVARSSSAGIKVTGPNASISMTTRPYGIATFTCIDDNTRGDMVWGSASSPSGYYGGTYLDIDITTNVNLSHIRFLHANRALRFADGSNTVSHAQFTSCAEAISPGYSDVHLRNSLANNIGTFIGSASASGKFIRGEHWTLHSVSNLVGSTFSPSFHLTNCLLVAVTNLPAYYGEANTNISSDAGVFEGIAAGQHYLPASSPYRSMTTAINVSVRSELNVRTTYAPASMSNAVIWTNTVWTPMVPRDTYTVGWHYPALDYYCSGTVFSNSTVVLTNGAAIGFDFAAGSWGLIFKNSRFISVGGPLAYNHLVRTHCVQEKGSSNPGTRSFLYDGLSLTASNEYRVRFTEYHQLPNDGYFIYVGTKFAALEWTHSSIYDPSLVVDTAGGNYLTIGLTNTLIKAGGGQFGLSSSSANTVVHMRNCLLSGYSHHFVGAKSTWTVNDNLFDSSGLYDHGVTVTNVCNAYYNCGTTVLSGGTSNLVLTNLTYAVGRLGDYYQPTNSVLLNRGSTSADWLSLYHFTTTTDQSKETNGVVDIGLHFVAVDANGNALDADGDGVSDHLEDRNGNGLLDSGETDPSSATDPGLRILITRPRTGTFLP